MHRVVRIPVSAEVVSSTGCVLPFPVGINGVVGVLVLLCCTRTRVPSFPRTEIIDAARSLARARPLQLSRSLSHSVRDFSRTLFCTHLLLPVCALPAFLCNLLIPHCNEGVHADGFRTLHAANAIFAPDPAVSFAGLY